MSYMKKITNILVSLFGIILIAGCGQNTHIRNTISLNGNWQIADGDKDLIPSSFDRTITVPGLVTLATPAFINPAPPLPDRKTIDNNTELFYHQKDSLRETYWYRRTVNISQDISEIALLKVGKAMFGTRVFLNGTYIGEHLPCFTPGYFDLKKAIHKGDNDLVIAVGASRSSIPSDMPDGFDYEKVRYISGIFDNVDLILSGTPYVQNVQVAPDIEKKSARIQTKIFSGDKATSSRVAFVIRETSTGKIAGSFTTGKLDFGVGGDNTIDINIPIENCSLWTPEKPFLYTLEVSTVADSYKTRFGMRELHFDPLTHQPVLNGKPYFLRGTNITLYRFFEDPLCDSLPWNYDWVRRMHKKFKNDMYWNSYRNCIGFPPEEWYNIADEEGFMIQDEFPIWYGGPSWNKWIKKINSDELATEYREWMQERWNHPSVIIWDANNETLLTEPSIDSAIAKVRPLDLSGRSWDNSYSTNRYPGDIFESHPYHFSDPNFKFRDIAKASIIPEGNSMKNPGTNPVIINEYGWLWLNRDGSTTTLTEKLYENLLGKESTPETRWETYAKYTAAETEFWRCHRNAAGVLHFTALGYARSNGQTCDNWIDLANLTWEPNFLKYMHDAFSPIGLMVDFWDDNIALGSARDIPVIAINDLEEEWKGTVMFRILESDKVVLEKSREITIGPFGKTNCSFTTGKDLKEGKYTIEVSLVNTPFGTVRSVRNFRI
jgi:beta-galactosidase